LEFEVFGPRAGRGFGFVATLVRASGRGVPSYVERLEEALAVALTGRDVTIDLREVEKLGPEGIAALSRASAIKDLRTILEDWTGPIESERRDGPWIVHRKGDRRRPRRVDRGRERGGLRCDFPHHPVGFHPVTA
jgi:hypothetical protein